MSCICAMHGEAPGDTAVYKKNPNYEHEINLYKIYKKKSANIVMLGNSITHGVNWNELLGRDDIVERGIPSDILEGFLSRMDYVLSLKPKMCFIMGGINDIYNWRPVDQLFKTYISIIEILKKNNVRPVVQSTLYVAKKYPSSADRNSQVEKLNALLKDYCKKNNIEFLDLNEKLSVNKYLRDEVTFDALHLNANGYKIWGQEIEKVLLKYPAF